MFNLGGWLTHGDFFALAARVDFLAVVERRLIPARVRGEWARLESKGVGFGLGSRVLGFFSCRKCWRWGYDLERCSSCSAFFPATAHFRRFFDCGRCHSLPASSRWW